MHEGNQSIFRLEISSVKRFDVNEMEISEILIHVYRFQTFVAIKPNFMKLQQP